MGLHLIGWKDQLRGVLCNDEKRNTATWKALVEDQVEDGAFSPHLHDALSF